MRTFRREAGAYVAVVEPAERAVLLDVVDEVVALVAAEVDEPGPETLGVRMASGPLPPPTDPALRRLLPDASRDDHEVAVEYRRLTEADLRSTKTENLLRLRAVLSDAEPDLLVVPSEAAGVAAALTDLRLVLSERLGIRTDADADRLYERLAAPPSARAGVVSEVERFLGTVYLVLNLMQESLVTLMLDELGGGTAPTGGSRAQD